MNIKKYIINTSNKFLKIVFLNLLCFIFIHSEISTKNIVSVCIYLEKMKTRNDLK